MPVIIFTQMFTSIKLLTKLCVNMIDVYHPPKPYFYILTFTTALESILSVPAFSINTDNIKYISN